MVAAALPASSWKRVRKAFAAVVLIAVVDSHRFGPEMGNVRVGVGGIAGNLPWHAGLVGHHVQHQQEQRHFLRDRDHVLRAVAVDETAEVEELASASAPGAAAEDTEAFQDIWRWGELEPSQVTKLAPFSEMPGSSPSYDLFQVMTPDGARLVKRFSLSTADKSQISAVQNEIKSIIELSGNDVFLNFYDTNYVGCESCGDDGVFVMTEPYGGTLDEMLEQQQGSLDVSTVLSIFSDLVSAIRTLCLRRIAHEAPTTADVLIVGRIDSPSTSRAVLCSSVASTSMRVCSFPTRAWKRLSGRITGASPSLLRPRDMDSKDVAALGQILKKLLASLQVQHGQTDSALVGELRKLVWEMVTNQDGRAMTTKLVESRTHELLARMLEDVGTTSPGRMSLANKNTYRGAASSLPILSTFSTSDATILDSMTAEALEEHHCLMWRNLRSERGRLLATDDELVAIATLINDLVDLPYWNEEEEQDLFECATNRCIEVIADSLPPPLMALPRKSEGLEESEAILLGNNMVQVCRNRLDLPYLDEQDKRRIIRGVVWVLVGAMQEGRNMNTFTVDLHTNPSAQEIIVNVFMEGAMDVFFEEDLRRSLVTDMALLARDFLFLPPGLVERFVDFWLVLISDSLRVSLKIAFKEYRVAAFHGEELPLEPKGLEGPRERAWIQKRYPEAKFLIQLRRVFVEQVQRDRAEDKTTALLISLVPEKLRAWFLSRFLDIIIAKLQGVEKIEDSVQLFENGDALPRESFEEGGELVEKHEVSPVVMTGPLDMAHVPETVKL